MPSATCVATPLRISYDADLDSLFGLRPDVVVDGHPGDAAEELLEGLHLFRSPEDLSIIGFHVGEAFAWDVAGCEEHWLWSQDFACFSVPTLGLSAACLGEVVLAAQHTLISSTPDVVLFDLAVTLGSAGDWEQAEQMWRLCLATGELKAHFGLGYTLVELGRPREAFGHLLTYTELAPRLAWAWSWRARAALEMDDHVEARKCFERALAVEAEGGGETDAAEHLAELEAEGR
ncbi:MAG: tetratricopeptide repeat protein [Solirubrobacterales bacterium]|nr:tetratricopeptide repeat protein [Solirubrobacterales bacterium]